MTKVIFFEKFMKYKHLIMLIPTFILLLLCGICEPLLYVACVFLGLFLVTCSVKELICYVMFLQFFSGYQPFFMTGLLVSLSMIILYYVIDVVKHRKKIFKGPLILTLIILVVFSCINYGIDYNGFEQGAMIWAAFIAMYLLFVYKKEIDVGKCFSFAFLGLLTSIGLGLLTLLFKDYRYLIMVLDSEKLHRLQLLTVNPNHLSMLVLFMIAFYIYQIVCSKGELWVNLTCAIISCVVGFLTLSKAFLVVLIGYIGYILIFLIVKYKKKSLRVIIPLAIILSIVIVIFRGYFIELLNRFVIYGSDLDSLIYKITTGRSALWQAYISDMTSSLEKMLFGVGIFSKGVISQTPHNTLIFYLYRVGFFGMILIGVLIYSYYKNSEHKIRMRYSNCLLFLAFFVIALEEVILNDRFTIFFILSLVLMSESPEAIEDYTSMFNKQLIKILKIDETKLDNFKEKMVESYTNFMDKLTIKKPEKENNEDVVDIKEKNTEDDLSLKEIKKKSQKKKK